MTEGKHWSFSQLKELTLVIPTARGEHVRDLILGFHEHKPYSVVVVSQTPDENCHDIFPVSPNILWINGPNSFHQRLLLASRHIHTAYVCMCGDDEIHFLTGLSQSLEFLQLNSEYVTCSGYPVGFVSALPLGNANSCQMSFPVGFLKQAYKFPSRLYDNPADHRIVSHFADYQPRLIYSVTRADKWINVWKLFSTICHYFPYRGFHEIFYESAISFYGMSHLVPTAMWYRSSLFANFDNNKAVDTYLNDSKLMVKDVFNSTSPLSACKLDDLGIACGEQLATWVYRSLNIYSDSFSRDRFSRKTLQRRFLRFFWPLTGRHFYFYISKSFQLLLPRSLFYSLVARCSFSPFIHPLISRILNPCDRKQLYHYLETVLSEALVKYNNNGR
jgi:glycosyltransferase domain-containing protein